MRPARNLFFYWDRPLSSTKGDENGSRLDAPGARSPQRGQDSYSPSNPFSKDRKHSLREAREARTSHKKACRRLDRRQAKGVLNVQRRYPCAGSSADRPNSSVSSPRK